MNDRKVLFFDPSAGFKMDLQNCPLKGWNCVISRAWKQATRLMETDRFRVGAIFFSGLETEKEIDTIQRWMEVVAYETGLQTEWIALTPPVDLRYSDALCRIIRQCFYDFNSLPLDWNRLGTILGHAYGMTTLAVTSAATDAPGDGQKIVGKSPAMRKLHRGIKKLGNNDAPALITGESGTGKALIAKAIHKTSKRAKQPFMAVCCGAFPKNLIQVELFGHGKSSFKGVHQTKIGLIESAAGGTLFLDEIGEMPLDVQINFLRFLDQRTVYHGGAGEPISVDVRVIAATNIDLQAAVDEGRFRSDLFYRLNVVHLDIPPLRDREDDLEELANFFFDKFSGETQHLLKGFSLQALQVMKSYRWPGNVRELINRVRRATIMCETSLINPSDLGLEARTLPRQPIKLFEARAEAEKRAINIALKRTGNNVSQAARDLGIARRTLYHLKEKHRIA